MPPPLALRATTASSVAGEVDDESYGVVELENSEAFPRSIRAPSPRASFRPSGDGLQAFADSVSAANRSTSDADLTGTTPRGAAGGAACGSTVTTLPKPLTLNVGTVAAGSCTQAQPDMVFTESFRAVPATEAEEGGTAGGATGDNSVTTLPKPLTLNLGTVAAGSGTQAQPDMVFTESFRAVPATEAEEGGAAGGAARGAAIILPKPLTLKV